MRRMVQGRASTVLAFVLGLVIAAAATAGAASLITGKQIKDGTISEKDLNKALRAQLAKPGPIGAKGDPGAPGVNGQKGEPGQSGNAGPAAMLFATRFPSVYGGGFGQAEGTASGSYTESAVQQLSPAVAIMARDLVARHIDDAGSAGSVRGFILRVNGADTPLACTLTRPEQYCQNTTAQVPIPAGSLLSIRTEQAGSSITGTGTVLVSFRATIQ